MGVFVLLQQLPADVRSAAALALGTVAVAAVGCASLWAGYPLGAIARV